MKESHFMGKVTAAMTHEIKNVLAIIRESAGLAQDLLALAGDTGFPHKEKFLKVMDKIDKQVERGADIVSLLNTFAHVPDNEIRHEDLNSILDQMVGLSHKLSRLNGVNFTLEEGTRSVFLEANPMKTRMIIYRALEFLAPLLGKGSEIRLKAMKSSHGLPALGLFIKTAGPVVSFTEKILSSAEWNSLEAEFNSENAVVEPSPGRDSIVIHFVK